MNSLKSMTRGERKERGVAPILILILNHISLMSESNDERPTKRQRTRSPPPIASTSSLPRTEGLDAHLSRNASNDNNNNVGPATTTQAGASVAEEDEPEMTQAELDEKWRIYEMISEEYHDSSLSPRSLSPRVKLIGWW